MMHAVPNPGDVYPLETGEAVILEVENHNGCIRVLASRAHPVHPFAIWRWDSENNAFYSGRYFERLAKAETAFWEET
jgi:hypothetical protein